MSWQDRLDGIAQRCTTEGWDSYGAAGITSAAIATARSLCESLDVVPSVNGGIAVDLGRESVTLNIDSDGNVSGVYIDTEDANDWLDRSRRALAAALSPTLKEGEK